eukprot:8871443-Pyramimonas_sp.AAC.1
MLFLTNAPYGEVQLVSKNGCIGRCVRPLRVCGSTALTPLVPTGRRHGSMFRIQIRRRTTPIGFVLLPALFSHPTCDPTSADRPTA